jgi:hypothetical protein
MTEWPNTLHKFGVLTVSMLTCALNTSASGQIRSPSRTELENLVGEPLPYPIKSVKWQATEPPTTNLLIYAVQPPIFKPEGLKSLAAFLDIKGEPEKLPPSIIYTPGYWIKEPNPTNKETWKALVFSEIAGMIRYGSGEDNHKWDLKAHKPLAHGVPDEKEALRRALALLPALGITTNDLEHLPDSNLKYACNTEGTWYNDRNDNWTRKRYIRQINVEFWQKIQDGASVFSIGGGGTLRVGYISEGHLAEVEMTFRNGKPIGTAQSRTSKELIQMLKRGEGRSFHRSIPTSLTITSCALVYPEANSATKQDFLWPFYALSAVSIENGETNSLFICEPLSP